MMPASARYRLIDRMLDGRFDEWVAARRPARSWQEIADEVRELTGERPTRETVRLWFEDRLVTETRVVTGENERKGGAGTGPGRGGSRPNPKTDPPKTEPAKTTKPTKRARPKVGAA